MSYFKSKIREVPDWPKKGVNFKDITPLLQDKEIFRALINELSELYKDIGIHKIVGIDARGFLLAAPVAYTIGAGLAIVRKAGKLPHKTIAEDYALEYGSGTMEMHQDAIMPGEKVVLVDDLIATGGTALAACNLIEKLGGEIVGISCVVDLPFLSGSKKLKERGYKIHSVVSYDNE